MTLSLRTKNGLRIIRILTGRSNVFLLTDGEKNILIDTSPAYRWKALNSAFENHAIKHLDFLILTHSHFDHSDNASKIKEKFGCKVIIHRSEEQNLLTGEMSRPEGTNFFTRFIVTNLAPLLINRLRSIPCQPDILIDDDYSFSNISLNVRIIHTPGHSPGSVSVIADEEIVIAADTIFGIVRNKVFPPYAADAALLVRSWKILLDTGCSVFLPSHGRIRYRKQLQKEYDKRKVLVD